MADSFVELLPDSSGKKVQQFENVIGGNTVEAMAISSQNPSGWSGSYVEVGESTGKLIQYFKNTIGGIEVYAQALCLVKTTGVPI